MIKNNLVVKGEIFYFRSLSQSLPGGEQGCNNYDRDRNMEQTKSTDESSWSNSHQVDLLVLSSTKERRLCQQGDGLLLDIGEEDLGG